jgi:hypothetical protein
MKQMVSTLEPGRDDLGKVSNHAIDGAQQKKNFIKAYQMQQSFRTSPQGD